VIAAAQVFDDFCRDFDRVPVAWHLDPGPSPRAGARAEAIGRWIDGHRHVRLAARPVDVPPLWFPAVALGIGRDAPATAVAPSVSVARIDVDDATDVSVLCESLAARARASQVDALRRAIAGPAATDVALSAVIPTHHRPAALTLVLDSLARQTCDPALFEVVVVNNDPSDAATNAVVDDVRRTRFADRPERLRLVGCPFPGLSFARNAGIACARGAVVAFLDDDAEATPDWAAAMHAAFAASPDAGVVGGRVRLAVPSPRPRWVKPGWERYWSECAMNTQTPVVARHWWDYPFGANWAARRAVLLAIGGFRTRFGRTGSDAAGGEEIAAAALVERLGHRVVVDPRIEVVHRPDPTRFTFGHVWRRIHAGKREEYAQERLGYLPPALGLGATTWSVARRLKTAILARGLAPHQRLEELIHASAEARILPALVRDRRAASSG
jgi:glycosyltransferase involved in cell wall biosynthesis